VGFRKAWQHSGNIFRANITRAKSQK